MMLRSTLEAATVLRESDGPVVVRGSGTKQDWGIPRQADLTLETRALTGIVEHVAGDLVVVVRAGMPMAELQTELAKAGQQLALDTPYPHATVGGTVAVNTSGPRRVRYGTVRDLLIGLTIVRADGVIAKAGGKVVKNVAGYDIGKLFTGSHGTLGLITECAFRLHPLPSTSTYVRCSEADLPRLRQMVPTAVEVDAPLGGPKEFAVLFEGPRLGLPATDTAPEWWGKYPWEPGGIGLKLTGALSKLSALFGMAHVRGSLGVGVLYATCAPEMVEELRAAAHGAGGHAVVLTAPPSVELDRWGPVPGLELMRQVKQQFDPRGRFGSLWEET